MSVDARTVALQGLVPAGATGVVILVTGEPSADLERALAARIDRSLQADTRAPLLTADQPLEASASLQANTLTAEIC